MAPHNAMSTAFSIQEIAFTILFSMPNTEKLDLSVPHFVMICQTQTNMAERAWRLSMGVKITMLWQLVRWHGAVTILNLGREEKLTSRENYKALSTPSMAPHNAMSTAFSIQEIAFTILFSMPNTEKLDLSVPHFVMICQTQTNMAERAWRLSMGVKITMLWQLVRWHGAVTILNLGREEKLTSRENYQALLVAEPFFQLIAGIITFS